MPITCEHIGGRRERRECFIETPERDERETTVVGDFTHALFIAKLTKLVLCVRILRQSIMKSAGEFMANAEILMGRGAEFEYRDPVMGCRESRESRQICLLRLRLLRYAYPSR